MAATWHRPLLIWLASFSLAAAVLICYFGAPWLPLGIAGVVTLAWTLARSVARRQ